MTNQPQPPYQPGGYHGNGQPSFPYQQPYGQPYGQPQRQPGNGFGITAMVLGILALLTAIIPFVNLVSFVLGIAVLVFGLIGVTRRDRAKGTSITGLICGGLALVVAVLVNSAAFAGLNMWADAQEAKNPEVVFKVYSEKTGEVTYNYEGTPEADEFVKGNWEKSVRPKQLHFLYVMVQGDVYNYSRSDVSCEILIDGKSVSKKSGRGTITCEYDNFSKK